MTANQANNANIAESLHAQAQLENHTEPLGGGEEDDDVLSEDTGPQSYAAAAKPTWTLEIHLYREDKSSDYNVSEEEMFHLIYKRLGVPIGGLVSIDDTPMRKILLELKTEVTAETLNITQALQIRKNLMTRPLQSMDKEKIVKIYWAPTRMPNDNIDNVMKIFGDIITPTKNKVITPRPDADPNSWEAQMAGVIVAEREVGIKIKHNIPSYIMIRGTRVKVDYQGQPKTCSFCSRYWTTCVGGGKADKCKKNGGQEKPTKIAFKQLVNKIKGKEVNAQETSGPLIPLTIPDPDRVQFSGFPEDWPLENFRAWLDSNQIAFLEPMLFKGGRPGSFHIATVSEGEDVLNLSGNEAREMVEKLNGSQLLMEDGKTKRRIRVESGVLLQLSHLEIQHRLRTRVLRRSQLNL